MLLPAIPRPGYSPFLPSLEHPIASLPSPANRPNISNISILSFPVNSPGPQARPRLNLGPQNEIWPHASWRKSHFRFDACDTMCCEGAPLEHPLACPVWSPKWTWCHFEWQTIRARHNVAPSSAVLTERQITRPHGMGPNVVQINLVACKWPLCVNIDVDTERSPSLSYHGNATHLLYITI